jgi:metal-responsive CopG/Arc/MetJ family transcriptional regulator
MISVRMDADEADILDTAAAAAGVSRSDMIRAAVSDYIGRAVRKHTRANAHDGRGG